MGIFDWVSDNILGIDPSEPDPQLMSLINSQTNALAEQTRSAKAATDAALKAATDANLLAQAASMPAVDSESSRSAQDALLRKRVQGQGGAGLPTQFGAAPVGYRMLSGQ